MTKHFLPFAILLTLCCLGGCSKDDDSSDVGSDVQGYFRVDGIEGQVKYGYVYYDDSGIAEYGFYDKNVLDYIGMDFEELDVEFSSISFYYHPVYQIEDLYFGYKVNYAKESGKVYESEGTPDDYLEFSTNNGNVKCSSTSIPMTGYDIRDDRELGTFNASFSINGQPLDVSDLVDDYDTRGIEVTQVNDSKEIAFLRSLRAKVKNAIPN